MSDNDPIDGETTTFDGSRREQLRRAQSMTVRERLEAMNELVQLSERMQTMPKQPGDDNAHAATGINEDRTNYARRQRWGFPKRLRD